jgi:hypothetical protein
LDELRACKIPKRGRSYYLNYHIHPIQIVKDLYVSLYAFHLGQIISTVLGQVDHGGQHGNAAETPIRDKMSETDHTQKRRFRHCAIYQTIKALAILRYLYGLEMVLLGVVIGKCEMPSTDIVQENDHAILIVKRQFVTYKFR